MANKSMTRWDQLEDLVPLRAAVDRLYENGFVPLASWLAAWRPGKTPMALDVYEEDDNLIVKAALPGLKPNEVKIRVQGDVMTITGESKEDPDKKERNYQLREHLEGRLERSVVLPVPVDVDKAEAVFADGVLTLTLPKTEDSRAKQITIKRAS